MTTNNLLQGWGTSVRAERTHDGHTTEDGLPQTQTLHIHKVQPRRVPKMPLWHGPNDGPHPAGLSNHQV